MSRPDPTWYGNVIRSYVAWLVVGIVAGVVLNGVLALPSSPTVERICVAIYAALLVLVVAGLTWG